MSHFSVLVIGNNPEEQLEPYHEFESTGINKHIQNIDQLEEARAKYQSAKVNLVRAPDGTLLPPYDDRFYRDPTPEERKKIGSLSGIGWGDGHGYRAKVHHIPEGYEEVELNAREAQSFTEFVKEEYGRPIVNSGQDPDLDDEHKYGWIRLDEKGEVVELVKRTNPNAKWDWYVLGGRWRGGLLLKPEYAEAVRHHAALKARDEPIPDSLLKMIEGIQCETPSWMDEKTQACYVDQAPKGKIDFERMLKEARDKAARRYDEVAAMINGRPFMTWKEVREQYSDIDEARRVYHDQEVVRDAWDKMRFLDIDEFHQSREDYIEGCSKMTVCTFAVIKDGQWYERGSMGWWGVVSDEMEPNQWYDQFWALLDGLPDDTLLSIYDCHI